jgi:hypothetical protein
MKILLGVLILFNVQSVIAQQIRLGEEVLHEKYPKEMAMGECAFAAPKFDETLTFLQSKSPAYIEAARISARESFKIIKMVQPCTEKLPLNLDFIQTKAAVNACTKVLSESQKVMYESYMNTGFSLKGKPVYSYNTSAWTSCAEVAKILKLAS